MPLSQSFNAEANPQDDLVAAQFRQNLDDLLVARLHRPEFGTRLGAYAETFERERLEAFRTDLLTGDPIALRQEFNFGVREIIELEETAPLPPQQQRHRLGAPRPEPVA
jgi:hypothetical protein